MSVRQFVVIVVALALGAACTEVADDWGHRGPWTELWFFGLVPAVLDVLRPSMAWSAATAVYAIQCLAVYSTALDCLSVQVWLVSPNLRVGRRIL